MPSLPRVTQILAEAAISDARWFTDASRERGSAMHAACEFDDLGELDEDTVDPVVAPLLASFRKFRDEMRPTLCPSETTEHGFAIEETVTDKAGRYVGHLDRRYLIGRDEVCVDLKGLDCTASHCLQIAMYVMPFGRPIRRACLHLSPKGYRWIEHKDRDDFKAAEAILTLRAWKERHS